MRGSGFNFTQQTPMHGTDFSHPNPPIPQTTVNNKLFFGIGSHRINQQNFQEREHNKELAQTYAKMRAKEVLEKKRISDLQLAEEMEEYGRRETKRWSEVETLRA